VHTEYPWLEIRAYDNPPMALNTSMMSSNDVSNTSFANALSFSNTFAAPALSGDAYFNSNNCGGWT
jgi:hypothetical protein